MRFLLTMCRSQLLTTFGKQCFQRKLFSNILPAVSRCVRKESKRYHEADIDRGYILFKESKGFDKNLPIILVIHGMAMGADSHFVNGLLNAYIKRGIHHEYNIFAIDMPKLFENNLFNNFYFGVLSNVEPAGEKIGELLSNVISLGLSTPEKINMVGYSIGAQVAGYAARLVKSEFDPINYIAGLDPAGPGFHTMFGRVPRLTHVSRDDAQTTHFFHTNSMLCGTKDRVGTADFVFNGGSTQPGCTRDASLDCSHSRIPYLYIEAVAKPRSFVSRRCESWDLFISCECGQQKTTVVTFPPDARANGTYYLYTNAESPFGMGNDGAKCYRTSDPKYRIDDQENQNESLPLDLNLFENQKKNISEEMFSHKDLKNDFNIQIINGIKKIEDFQQVQSKTQRIARIEKVSKDYASEMGNKVLKLL